MIVEVYNESKVRINTPIQFTVERFSFDAYGGPANATIEASGPKAAIDVLRSWLGYYFMIRNKNFTPVYWGLLDGVTYSVNGLRRGYSRSDIRNRIRALYTFTDGEGISYPMATDWIEDSISVQRYGTFEEQRSVGETTEEQAETVRNRALAWQSKPLQTFGTTSQTSGATLRCMGLWSTNRQVYARRDDGREVYTGLTTYEQKFGWGLSGTDIGFADLMFQKVEGGFDFLEEGDRVVVSGSSSNNTIYTLFENPTGKADNLTFNDLAFNGIDDIDSVAGNLGFVRKGTFIQIIGSEFNDRYHLTDNVSREHVTTDQNKTGNILTENGLPITIKQGQTVRTVQAITYEAPGALITVKQVGEKLLYIFTSNSLIPWTIAEVWVRLRKEGSPVDSARVTLYEAPGDVTGAAIQSAAIPASQILTRFTWVKFVFPNTMTVTYGNRYAFMLDRTGALHPLNFYATEIDEDQGHAGGVFQLWNGTTWEARPQGSASVPFQIWGHKSTTEQITNMLASNNQYFSGYEVRYSSNIYTRQYRDGTNFLDLELEKLLDPGSEYDRLLPRITEEWRAIIEPVPAESTVKYMMRGNQIVNRNGNPLEDGRLPVGEWCILEDEPDQDPFLIGFMEYDAAKNRISDIRAIDAPDPWSQLILQG